MLGAKAGKIRLIFFHHCFLEASNNVLFFYYSITPSFQHVAPKSHLSVTKGDTPNSINLRLFIEITSCLHMIYAIARLNILAMLSILIEKTERSLRLAGVLAPTPRRAIPQIFNRQYSIPACPGWVKTDVVKKLITRHLTFILFLFLFLRLRFKLSVFRICYCAYLS